MSNVFQSEKTFADENIKKVYSGEAGAAYGSSPCPSGDYNGNYATQTHPSQQPGLGQTYPQPDMSGMDFCGFRLPCGICKLMMCPCPKTPRKMEITCRC